MNDQQAENEAAVGQSALTDGLCMEVPIGWKFEPLYRRCPRCGCDLGKEFVPAKKDENHPNSIEREADKSGVARMPTNDANGMKLGLQGMISPLAETNPENSEGNKRGWNYGEGLEKSSARKNEYKNANDHKDLVPIIKRNFGQRIIQWLLRAMD
jgi:hypothetical protein